MIELVVFDLAGTTVYDGDAVNDCLRAALAAAGVPADPAAVNDIMGLPKPEGIRRLLTAAGAAADDRTVTTIHDDFARRMTRYYAADPAVREVPGASATFAALRAAGVRVGLDTGFSRDIVTVLLDRLGWATAVDATVTSDEVARGRPYPDMVRHLMGRVGVSDPARVAKVGDTPVDLEEGTAAGCGLVIGVTTGPFSRDQLARHPHTHLLATVADVPAVVLPR